MTISVWNHKKIHKKQGAGFLGCVRIMSNAITQLKDTGCKCYNQATTNLAFHSIETSKDKLSIIWNWRTIIVIQVHPNYTKTCSFLHAHYTE